MKNLLLMAAFVLAARADTFPPLPFGSHADLGYIAGFDPVTCDQNNSCSGYRYFPEAESPDRHWVGVALYDLDVDAWLWLWHDGEYVGTFIDGPFLTVGSIDNNGVAKGAAFPCYSPGVSPGSTFLFSSDVGCVASLDDGGDGSGSPASVPEPSGLALLGLAAVGICGRVYNRR